MGGNGAPQTAGDAAGLSLQLRPTPDATRYKDKVSVLQQLMLIKLADFSNRNTCTLYFIVMISIVKTCVK